MEDRKSLEDSGHVQGRPIATPATELELGPPLGTGSSSTTMGSEQGLISPFGSSRPTHDTELELGPPLCSSGATPVTEQDLGPPLGKTFTTEELDVALEHLLSRAGDHLLQVNLHNYLGNIDEQSSDKGISYT